MRRLAFMALGAGLLVAACGGTGSAVRPFSEVQATEFVFEADPTNPSRAIFRMETTEPMICAIIWGETESLGNFNNSLAMNGTGIVRHDVFLPDAEPGVEYFYKVQGSTADGTLYESELATFVIPVTENDGAGEEDMTRGDNLSLMATVVETSSEFSDTWAGTNAIDGDTTTEWATAGDSDDAYIIIDLGSAEDIAGVEFLTRSMADGTATTTEYTVTVDSGDTFGPFPAGNLADTRFTELVTTGKIFRFDIVNSTGGNTGAIEIRVFAP
jgi:hypothetical protein